MVNVTITNAGTGYLGTDLHKWQLCSLKSLSVVLGSSSVGGAGNIVLGVVRRNCTLTKSARDADAEWRQHLHWSNRGQCGTLAGTGTLSSGERGQWRAQSGNRRAGTLTTSGNTILDSGSKLAISAAAVGTSTSVTVTGAATFDFKTGSVLDLSLIGGFGTGGTYTLVSMPTGNGGNIQLDGIGVADGFVLGTFVQGTGASGAVTITPTGFSFTTGDTLTLSRSGDAVILNFSPVPEPATVLGIAAGAMGLGGLVRRRFRRA